MFKNLRWRLLAAQLSVMAAILVIFGVAIYAFFWRSLHQQLDKKLLTLAQSATPTLSTIQQEGDDFLDEVDAVPWRDIFNRDLQSLEWFDANGRRLANRGALELSAVPQVGIQTLHDRQNLVQVRMYTISVFEDTSLSGLPELAGYVRASQSLEDIETVLRQLRWGLVGGGTIALGLVSIGGLWLTRRSLHPIEKSFETLRQFTADASHELRSPLTAIKTSIEVIQNHPERIHPKDVKKLEAIASATDQMHQLTEDLLLLARSDANLPTSWSSQMVDLNAVLKELIILLEPSAQAKSISLQFKCWTDVWVQGDPSQLYRMFSNLIQNAIQYTPPMGKVSIILTRQARMAIATVADTGIGIAEDHLSRIFDRFWRADKARSRRQGGTGLGLAIAQAIVHRHGGVLTVTSQVGVGSSFRVSLPLVVKRDAKKIR